MDDNKNKDQRIDDDILQSRMDILRIKNQLDASSKPADESESPAKLNTDAPARRIPSFEDLTARNKDGVPSGLDADTTDLNDSETDINNDTAHAFRELLAGGHDDSTEKDLDEEKNIENSQEDTRQQTDHDPLAIIGKAVKMAQLEHPQGDEPQKSGIADEAENTLDLTDYEDVDVIDFDNDDETDDDFEQLERQLQELGIAGEEDEDPLILQQTPPEPAIDQFHKDLLDIDKNKKHESLTDEERRTLTADLNDVKELLVRKCDDELPPEEAVPQFDLADQILVEQRKLAAAKRRPPIRTAPSPNIPLASGTVAQVIDENKKATLEAAQTPPENNEKKTDVDKKPIEPTDIPVNSCSPAVQSIISNSEELTEFQKQILTELVERDIELHFKDRLKSNSKNYPFKK